MEYIENLKAQFEAFMSSEFEESCVKATRMGWGGSKLTLEITEDSYRILDSVGNLYDSPGITLYVPELSDDDWDEEEENHFFWNCQNELRDEFEELVRDIEHDIEN